jgi:DNA polymerase III epsilon subunit-like protein
MTRNIRYVGFDLETTGSDSDTHQIIQVAVCPDGNQYVLATLLDEFTFSSDVGIANTAAVLNPKAMSINGFTLERLLAGPRREEVDKKLLAYLKTLEGAGGEYRIVCVGFNVGLFDVNFIKKHLPLSGERLSYQTVDLNAILFTLEHAGRGTFRELKDWAKGEARAELSRCGIPPNEHDALYDARLALTCWHLLITRFFPEAAPANDGVPIDPIIGMANGPRPLPRRAGYDLEPVD